MSDIDTRATDRNAAQRITLIGALFDTLLGFFKILVGAATHSSALVADGVHSLSDLVTDAFVLLATHYGRQAPDNDHPYGHGRIETLGTLALGIMLIAVAGALAWDSIQRLVANEALSSAGMGAIALTVASMLIKEILFRITLKVARRQRSQLLEANAWHSRSDALSSLVVLIGLIGLQFGLDWLDSVAAIVVSLMVARVGGEQLWQASRELVDTALPPEQHQRIKAVALEVDGVHNVHDLRTRTQSGSVMLDVHLTVDARISVSEGHEIGNMVIRRLRAEHPELHDIVFHIDPEDDSDAPRVEFRQELPLRRDIEAALARCWCQHPIWDAHLDLQFHYVTRMESREVDIELYVPAGTPVTAEQRRQLEHCARALPWIGHISLWQEQPAP
ncbi:cation diffusion facilitator family transporter [Larsenimonas rhizosphaerae]|uniref:Cation diffusion facilitator family transporter n=1 Tax=Larsenimonas rhizosphaerae TaxID=2944682 RepID=A0AA42CXC6_9GAMM|nr:cation diffusion facilitator family transporter [Larsenimonas rhizosphaerae]MCM2131025.1 cation diffusion facilitator family transporter [Larsenimonas rhizosphaerae]MCX2523730.1 cation diffusion facilitator family transporter [Larsenimonas rhizosphaerae]